MALIDEAQAMTRSQGTKCSVGLLAKSDPDLYAELVEALESDVSSNAIGRALKARGVPISGQSVNRHRTGVCKCD